jgi:hypothetical protein
VWVQKTPKRGRALLTWVRHAPRFIVGNRTINDVRQLDRALDIVLLFAAVQNIFPKMKSLGANHVFKIVCSLTLERPFKNITFFDGSESR